MAKMLLSLLAWLFVTIVQALVVDRPCMNVVRYVSQLDDRLLADIILTDPAGLEGVWLNITFDKHVHVLANKFGPAVTLDNKNFLIQQVDYKLKPGDIQLVRILIKHNDVVTPSIVKVLLNGRSICPGNFDLEEKQCPICPDCQELLEKDFLLQQANVTSPDQLSITPNGTNMNVYRKVVSPTRFNTPRIYRVDVKEVCGTITISKDKIEGGMLAEEGNFPWQMALIHTTGVSRRYACSAGLISQRYVLTAAHCVTVKATGAILPKTDYLLYAGLTDLNIKSDHMQVFQLKSIEVHPKYNSTTFEDDIAILELSRLADIGDYVRPLCLPTEKMSISDMYRRRALVAGWGYTESGLVKDLRFARMPIETPEQCLWSNREFYSHYISPKVFCAGDRNGTNVCQGDSGAPLALESTEPGQEDRYFIRGIVSVSRILAGQCSPYDYAIFTDVRTYMPWIREIVDVI